MANVEWNSVEVLETILLPKVDFGKEPKHPLEEIVQKILDKLPRFSFSGASKISDSEAEADGHAGQSARGRSRVETRFSVPNINETKPIRSSNQSRPLAEPGHDEKFDPKPSPPTDTR